MLTTSEKIAGSARAARAIAFDDKGGAKPAPTNTLVDGQTANQAGKQQGIARQPLCLVGR